MDDLLTLPGMTQQTVDRLAVYRIRKREDLHENICYQPQIVAYIADVSLARVTQWLAELERTEPGQ